MLNVSLPSQFKDLEPFAAKWAVADEGTRRKLRVTASMPELQAFYDAMLARMDEILPFLNQYELDKLPEDVTHLMYLSLALAEIAPAIELYRRPDVDYAFDVERFAPVRVPTMTPAI